MAEDDAREAIREAYQAYYRRLVATLYGLTADYGEAQDLVQEAYARALARPKTFLDVADPEAWLRTVAVNLARTRWRRRRLLDTMIRTGRVTPTPESVPGADPNRVLLVAALAKLSRPTRETIVLHHIADMSVHEVAEQLGVPVGTVKARLSRGRALLAELLHEAAPTAAVPSPDPAATRADAAGRGVAARRVGIMPARSVTPAQRTAADSDHRPAEPVSPAVGGPATWPNGVPANALDGSDLAARAELGHGAGPAANFDDSTAQPVPTGGTHPRNYDDGLAGLEPLLADSPTTTVDGLVAVRGRRR